MNQYYPPDAAPTGLMLQAVAERTAAEGHEVTVFCATGEYAIQATLHEDALQPERSSAVRVVRIGTTNFGRGSFLGKLADYASFYGGVAYRLTTLRPRPDRVITLTTPPFLSVPSRLMTKFSGARHAHWIMDLYPDVMVAHGMISEDGWIHRVLQRLARFGFGGKRFAGAITLGPDMAEKVSQYQSSATKAVEWVPLWGTENLADQGDSQALRRIRGWADNELVIMYSGNMGLGHRFDEILGASHLVDGSARFAFFGDGKRKSQIESHLRNHPDGRIEVHGYVPADQLAAHLRSGDVHLVTLEPKWTGTMLPSKLQGIFAAGRPAIFIGDPKSSSAGWVRESGGGWVVNAGDVDGLLTAIAEAGDPEVRAQRGEMAQRFHDHCFNPDINSTRLARFFIGENDPFKNPNNPA